MPSSYQHTIIIGSADIDDLNHVNNVAYLRIALDAAGAHWRRVAPADFQTRFGWMVRRHEIDYLNQAFLGDELEVKTWVGERTNATWDRHTTITRVSDVKPILKLVSTWMLIDLERQRPVRIDERIVACFDD